MISTILRYEGDLAATVQQAEEYAEVGIHMGIVTFPNTEPPAIIEDIAEALSKAR